MIMDVDFPKISRELIHEVPTRSEAGQLEVNEIARIDKPISYEEFFKNYLLKNVPCIFSASFTHAWRSRHEWVTEDGTPDFAMLESLFGQATVPVADCGREEFCSHPKTDMKMSEYLNYWQQRRATGNNPGQPCLYLKDWHFTRDFPDYQAYTTLPFFSSDWLNEFWETREDQPADDYKFVYMGPKGSWTPFHADVFRSYSWSANICGKKRWIFFPPGADKHLLDRHGNLVYDVRSEQLRNESLYPDASLALPKCLEVIQSQGETIFVPSNWHHQVHNLEDTISINHNWFNGCNIHMCWGFLQANLADVQREIADCRDMEGWAEQCQLVLRASAGTNYSEMFRQLETVAHHRLQALQQRLSRRPGSGRSPRRHVVPRTQPSLQPLYTPSPALQGRPHRPQVKDSSSSSGNVSQKRDANLLQTAIGDRGGADRNTEVRPTEIVCQKGDAESLKTANKKTEVEPSVNVSQKKDGESLKTANKKTEVEPSVNVSQKKDGESLKTANKKTEVEPSVNVSQTGDANLPQTASGGRGGADRESEGEFCSVGIAENGFCPPKDCTSKSEQEPEGSTHVEEVVKEHTLPERTGAMEASSQNTGTRELVRDPSMLERAKTCQDSKGKTQSESVKSLQGSELKSKVEEVVKNGAKSKKAKNAQESGETASSEELMKRDSLPEKAKSPQESSKKETCEKGLVKQELMPGKVSHETQEKDKCILDFRHHYRGDPSRVSSVHWGRCGASHAVFDLLQVLAVLEEMSADSEFAHLGVDCRTLVSAIQDAVKEFENESC